MADEPKRVPRRPDGTPKAFWYDPDHPWHIMHCDKEGEVSQICGHQ